MKTKNFIGTCVENPFERLEILIKVIDSAKEITKATFLKHCYIYSNILREMKQFPYDFSFYKYNNIYFYTWSAIEHFYQ